MSLRSRGSAPNLMANATRQGVIPGARRAAPVAVRAVLVENLFDTQAVAHFPDADRPVPRAAE
jgi:hypothetical protein